MKCRLWHANIFKSLGSKQPVYWSNQHMLAHRMDCAVLVQNSGNAFSAPNGNCDSLKFTHKIIAKPSVWPILRKSNAAVSDFRCQVWKKNSEFNRLCQSNGNISTFFTHKKQGIIIREFVAYRKFCAIDKLSRKCSMSIRKKIRANYFMRNAIVCRRAHRLLMMLIWIELIWIAPIQPMVRARVLVLDQARSLHTVNHGI